MWVCTATKKNFFFDGRTKQSVHDGQQNSRKDSETRRMGAGHRAGNLRSSQARMSVLLYRVRDLRNLTISPSIGATLQQRAHENSCGSTRQTCASNGALHAISARRRNNGGSERDLASANNRKQVNVSTRPPPTNFSSPNEPNSRLTMQSMGALQNTLKNFWSTRSANDPPHHGKQRFECKCTPSESQHKKRC